MEGAAMITVYIQVRRNDGPIEQIPVYGIDAVTLANSAFIAGLHYKADHPNFIIEGVDNGIAT